MTIKELMNTGANVQVVVNLIDLKELFFEWQSEFSNEKQKAEEETYLTVQEAADMLHCDPSTLWRWDKSGYLPKTKWCGKARYKMSDVKRLMEG